MDNKLGKPFARLIAALFGRKKASLTDEQLLAILDRRSVEGPPLEIDEQFLRQHLQRQFKEAQ